MSCEINFKANINILDKSFNNIEEIKNKIDENIFLVISLETDIKMLASSNPKDIVPEDWSAQRIDWINNQISEKLNLIYEYNLENFKLSCYIEYLEEELYNSLNKISKEENIN